MEADLINNVINIQKVIRGFLIRRKVFKKKKQSELQEQIENKNLESYLINNVIQIQKFVRGYLTRQKLKKQCQTKLSCEYLLESQLINSTIEIQKLIRGFLARQKYKILKKNDQKKNQYQKLCDQKIQKFQRLSKISFECINVDQFVSIISQQFKPKSKKLQPKYFQFDIFILASIEIQRMWRGFYSRLKICNYRIMKSNVLTIEKYYYQYKLLQRNHLNENIHFLIKQHYNLAEQLVNIQQTENLIINMISDSYQLDMIKNSRKKLFKKLNDFLNVHKINKSTETNSVQSEQYNTSSCKKDDKIYKLIKENSLLKQNKYNFQDQIIIKNQEQYQQKNQLQFSHQIQQQKQIQGIKKIQEYLNSQNINTQEKFSIIQSIADDLIDQNYDNY